MIGKEELEQIKQRFAAGTQTEEDIAAVNAAMKEITENWKKHVLQSIGESLSKIGSALKEAGLLGEEEK